jgi:hypothetical protein
LDRREKYPVVARLAEPAVTGYNGVVSSLTKQEQRVIGIIVLLLLTGWATRMWRTAHPPVPPPAPEMIQPAQP